MVQNKRKDIFRPQAYTLRANCVTKNLTETRSTIDVMGSPDRSTLKSSVSLRDAFLSFSSAGKQQTKSPLIKRRIGTTSRQ